MYIFYEFNWGYVSIRNTLIFPSMIKITYFRVCYSYLMKFEYFHNAGILTGWLVGWSMIRKSETCIK